MQFTVYFLFVSFLIDSLSEKRRLQYIIVFNYYTMLAAQLFDDAFKLRNEMYRCKYQGINAVSLKLPKLIRKFRDYNSYIKQISLQLPKLYWLILLTLCKGLCHWRVKNKYSQERLNLIMTWLISINRCLFCRPLFRKLRSFDWILTHYIYIYIYCGTFNYVV